MEQKSGLKLFFSSANLLMILVVILVFSLFSLARETVKYLAVKKDIDNLSKQISALEAENLKLNASLDYINTDFYKEQQVRLKFGLQKPGEKVIVLGPTQAEDKQTEPPPPDKANIIRWWEYFIK